MQMDLLSKHVQESKETSSKVLGTLQNHNDRLIKIEEKKKFNFSAIFKSIALFFGFGR